MVQLSDYSIEIAEDILRELESFKQLSSRDHESGGVLLGYIIKEQKYIRITKISTPCKKDKSSPTSFERDASHAQDVINQEFDNSDGKIIYLGEWHTHHESKPTPSNTDIRMIRKHYKVSILNENFLLLVIIGIKRNYIALFDGDKFSSCYYN